MNQSNHRRYRRVIVFARSINAVSQQLLASAVYCKCLNLRSTEIDTNTHPEDSSLKQLFITTYNIILRIEAS
jgi:hypothetical protein